MYGRQVFCSLPQRCTVFFQYNSHAGLIAGSVDCHFGNIIMQFQADGSINLRALYHANFLVRHKVLRERFFLVRCQPGKVRLVIGKAARHQLNVRPIIISQVAVPSLAKVAAAPSPLLLARGDMVVRHMEDTGFFAVVIAADEIIIRMVGHVGGGNRNILITGDIHTGRIILLVIDACCNREAGHIALPVIHYRMNIRWEYRLRIIVDRHRRVGPPQKCLRHRGTVMQLGINPNICLVRENGKACHTLGAEHILNFTDNNGTAAILIFSDIAVNRIKRAGTMMLRPVELDTAADPRSCQTNQRGFDNMVIINEIVVIRLIISTLDSATQFRKNHHVKILIFQAKGVINAIFFLITDFINHAVRIYFAAATLINTFFQEHRVFIRLTDRVGRNCHVLTPDGNSLSNIFHEKLSPILFDVNLGQCRIVPSADTAGIARCCLRSA